MSAKKFLFAITLISIATAIGIAGYLFFVKQQSVLAQTANYHYIRPNGGNYGLENGSDWNNAFDGIPATLVRGDTYYIAGGIYDMSGNIFDDAENGTAVITIKKANAADNSGVAGWDSSFASTVAELYNSTDTTYARALYFRKGYYTIDGVTGSGKNGHGILVRPDQTVKDNNRAFIVDINNANHITLKHLEIKSFTHEQSYAMQLNAQSVAVKVAGTLGPSGDGLIQYCYLHDYNLGFWSGESNWLIEYSYFDRLWGGGPSNNHAETINLIQSSGYTFRYNTVADNVTVSGITGTFVTHGSAAMYGPVSHVKIYDNIFMNLGNIVIGTATSLCAPIMDDWLIYNNTFYNTGAIRVDQRSSNPTLCPSPYTSTWATSNWQIKNNLFWDSGGAFTDNINSGFIYDYNYFNSCGTPPTVIRGIHDIISTEDISATFLDYINKSFHITSISQALNAGTDLGSPYDIDFNGVVRHQGAAWDIGAYEYIQAPPPLKGDFNSDSKVNNLDFTSFKNAFKSIFNSLFDLNYDSSIDVKDLGVLMGGWRP